MLVLGVVVGGLHLMPSRTAARGTFQPGQGGTMNTARMAERMGISEADLQKEIDSGKTMQEIATEHGVTFRGGTRPGSGSGAQRTIGTGSTTSSLSSSPLAQ